MKCLRWFRESEAMGVTKPDEGTISVGAIEQYIMDGVLDREALAYGAPPWVEGFSPVRTVEAVKLRTVEGEWVNL